MTNRTIIPLFFASLFAISLSAQLPKPNFKANTTPTFQDLVQTYQKLDSLSEFMQLQTIAYSDAGNPIHLMVVNKSKRFEPNITWNRNAVWLIMNGIHPGESEGIDASILYLTALAKNPKLIPDSVTILLIPAYNIDGLRNRKEFTRANQNGPVEKGFRASACNYDLNRDFLKADTKNTLAFYQIFQKWQPDVFLDTHTSNGADYQYTMTLITTQKQKLGGPAADFLYNEMNPAIYKDMQKKGFEMCPYVNVFGQSPDQEGYEVFIESPKFSTGYAALFGTLAFVAETHMLKPYPDRVKATYLLLESFQNYCQTHKQDLVRTKELQQIWMLKQTSYPTNYKVSREANKTIQFKGYELEKRNSTLGNYERNFYNKNKPFTRAIPYYDSCYATLTQKIPNYFILPQSWSKVKERLKANHVQVIELLRDTSILVTAQYISTIKNGQNPYEGHFVHSGISCIIKQIPITFYAGDWIIPTQQNGIRYIQEVLGAESWDGFMAWNFFDPILNEKEGFSDYAFEEDAQLLLVNSAELRTKFEDWKTQNPEKAKSKFEVLGYLYKNSPYYEKEHLRFPVYSVD
jgi:hypothetical protein